MHNIFYMQNILGKQAVCKNFFVTLHSCVCFRRRRGMNLRCLEAVHATLCLCSPLALVRRTLRPSWTSTFPEFSRPLAVNLQECCGIPHAPALLNSAPCLGEVPAPSRSLALWTDTCRPRPSSPDSRPSTSITTTSITMLGLKARSRSRQRRPSGCSACAMEPQNAAPPPTAAARVWAETSVAALQK